MLQKNRCWLVMPFVAVCLMVLGGNADAKMPQNPLASGPLPKKTAPTGMLELPTGGAGRILTSHLAGTTSARKMLMALRMGMAGYFSQFKVTSAFGDRTDSNLQAAFTARLGAVPVRGVMSIQMQGAQGQATLLFDRAASFKRSFDKLMEKINSVPVRVAQSGAPAPVRLTMTPLLDGSGQIGLPPGWHVTGSYKGTVDAVGPGGAAMGLGGYIVVTSPQTRGLYAGMPMVDFNDPVRAALDYAAFQANQARMKGMPATRITRVIDSRPVSGFTGHAAFLRLAAMVGNTPYDGLGLYSIAPTDSTQAVLYMSYVLAPSSVFKKQLPGMLAAWQSWGIKDSVFRERMNSTLQSMRETGDILTGANASRQEAYAHVNNAWDGYIRDEGTWEDPDGKRYTGSTQTFSHNQPIGNLEPVPLNRL